MPVDAPTAVSASDAIRAALSAELPEEMWADVTDLVRRIDAAVGAGDADAVRDLVPQLEAARTPVAVDVPPPAPARRRRSRAPVLMVVALLGVGVIAALALTGGSDDPDEDAGFAENTTTTEVEFEETTEPPETVPPGAELGDRTTMDPITVGPEGILDVELVWSSPADLDLAVVEPGGATVDVESGPSDTGGTHGGDGNLDCEENGSRETVSWDGAPPGQFLIAVSGFEVAACGDGTYQVTVRTTQGTSSAEGSVTDGEADLFDLHVAPLVGATTTAVPATTAPPPPEVGEEEASADDDAGLPTLVGLALLSGLAAAALMRGVDLLRRRSGPNASPALARDARPAAVALRPRLPAPAELRELANHTIHRLDVARP